MRRISEEMQKDESLMSAMRRVGALPDKTITIQATADGVLVGSGGESAEIFPEAADHIFVKRLSAASGTPIRQRPEPLRRTGIDLAGRRVVPARRRPG